jgi:hypothetical protein
MAGKTPLVAYGALVTTTFTDLSFIRELNFVAPDSQQD